MAFGSNQQVFQLGVTLIPIPTGPAIQVIPPRTCIGYYFGMNSGQTWAISNQVGASIGNSFVLTATERLTVDGPANFFIAAGGATMVLGVVFRFSTGYSLTP